MEVRPLPAACSMAATPFASGETDFSAQSCVAKHTGCWLEQARQVDVIGAKPNTIFAQCRPCRLVQPLHLVRDFCRSITPIASMS